MVSLMKQAKANHRSIEEEANDILRRVLLPHPGQEGLGTRIARRFSQVNGFDLREAPRTLPRIPPY